MILIICNSCGSLVIMVNRFNPSRHNKVDLYPATRYDFNFLYLAGHDFPPDPQLTILLPYAILDLPIAIATDTILLPYDFYDARQYWKVDEKLKIEYSSVIEFLKNNKEVIEKAKGVRDVKLLTYTKRPNKDLPDRYVMSVYGLNKNPLEKDYTTIYVVIDVSRQEGVAKFKLRCFTSEPNDYECNKSE